MTVLTPLEAANWGRDFDSSRQEVWKRREYAEKEHPQSDCGPEDREFPPVGRHYKYHLERYTFMLSGSSPQEKKES